MTSRTEIISDGVNMTKYHHITGSFVDSVEHSVDESFSGSDISQHHRNHRDYHNLARNGANSSDTLYYMKAMGREARDLPAILFYSLIGTIHCQHDGDTQDIITFNSR